VDGGVDETEYFPARFSAFQSKAQNVTESSITAEIVGKKKGAPRLRDVIVEVLSRKGAYIVFCSHSFTGPKIKTLRKAIKAAIREGRGDPSLAAAIDIYDANRIADWVNTHPSVALWLTEKVRGKAVSGFLTHEGWSRAPEINAVPWIDDDKPRFEPVNFAIPQLERKDRRRNVWTFAQAETAALTALATDKTALRIAGPSGFGKSRFAYELFNRRTNPPDEIENAALIYADLSIAGDDVAKLALEIADAGSPTILVVDECPDETHRKLLNLAQRAGSKLRP